MLIQRARRLPRRLLQLSIRSVDAHAGLAERAAASTPRRAVSHRLACTRTVTTASSSPAFQHQPPSPVHPPQRRGFSHAAPRAPPVSVDEFEELKRFLAAPATSGDAMQRAKDIVTGWMQRHVDPAMPGLEATVMVMVADAMQDRAFVLEVYGCLRDGGVSPSPLTLENTAVACAELGQWRTSLEVIDFMHQAVEIMQPSLDIYENAVIACHKSNKWMRAKQLLEEMRTFGFEASPELHVASIRLCISSGEATATRVLVHSFLRVFDKLLEPEETQETLTELFHAAVNAQSLPQALFFREELLAQDCDISKEIYTKLIHLCAMERQWQKARVMLAQFVDSNAPPPEAPAPSEYTKDIVQLLHDMNGHDIELPLAVYNAALRNFGRFSMFDEAMDVFSTMRERGVKPDATSFAALMCSCGTQVEDSERFFRELQQEQGSECEPTLDVVHAYLLVPSRAEQWEEVLRRYAVVHEDESDTKQLPLESDTRIQSVVAIAYGRLLRSEEMLRVFTSMKVKGMEPNLYVYGEALYAYIRQDQWRHTLLLFDHLYQQQTSEMREERVLENFSMLWDAAVLACERGEQVQRAATLFDTIVQQQVPISPVTGERLAGLLTSVPTATLWTALKPMPRLHRTLKKNRSNPRVLNAVLKRAVEENDVYLAEQIALDGEQELKLVLNSMTYALMLRLYARQEDQANFQTWWGKMEKAKVTKTVFVYRALLHHLRTLGDDCEDPAYLDAIARVLQSENAGSIASSRDAKKVTAELGRVALDTMEARGLTPDTLCLQNYLLLAQDPAHAAHVLPLVEAAVAAAKSDNPEGSPATVVITSRLLHTLFVTLGNFPDNQRVRKLLAGLMETLPREISEDALAAYCASNDANDALLLLRELLATGCSLEDEQVLLFLANSYSSFSSAPVQEVTRPSSANGVVIDMAALLCESEAVTMEASSLAFLIQHVVELSNWQQQDVFQASTEEEIDAMKELLVVAFSNFSIDQVTEFLSSVVDKKDFGHVESVIAALEDEQNSE